MEQTSGAGNTRSSQLPRGGLEYHKVQQQHHSNDMSPLIARNLAPMSASPHKSSLRTPTKHERSGNTASAGNTSPKQALTAKSPVRASPTVSTELSCMMSPMWPSGVYQQQPGTSSHPGTESPAEATSATVVPAKPAAVRFLPSLFHRGGGGSSSEQAEPTSTLSSSPITRACVKRKLQTMCVGNSQQQQQQTATKSAVDVFGEPLAARSNTNKTPPHDWTAADATAATTTTTGTTLDTSVTSTTTRSNRSSRRNSHGKKS